MALKGKVHGYKSGYIRIASGEEHIDKGRFIVRLKKYESEDARKKGVAPIADSEESITLQRCIDGKISQAIAEISKEPDLVKSSLVKAIAEEEKRLSCKLTTEQENQMEEIVRNRLVSDRAKKLGTESWGQIKKTMAEITALRYKVLAMLPEYSELPGC